MSTPEVPALPAAAGDAAGARRRSLALAAYLAFAILAALAAASLRTQANPILALLVGILVIAAWHRQLFAWPVVLGYVLVVILFIPIRRYTLGGGMPIALEPYRLVILVVLLAWGLALLVDPKTRWRKTGLEAPVLTFSIVSLASLALNLRGIIGEGISSEVFKQVSFFVSFLLVMYFASSVLRERKHVDRTLMLLVGGGALIGACAMVESRTGLNPFNHIHRFIPVLQLDLSATVGPPDRGGRVRAYASAQHPIALGAALVLLLPFAVYLYRRTGKHVWLAAGLFLTLGALSTGSRTAALMLMVTGVAFFAMRREETLRMLPLLVPLLIVCQVASPGTLGTFKSILFPGKSGLIAEQQGGGGTGTGRVADLGPSLEEWSRTPFFGQGFGTRLTSESDSIVNARILDDEWLGILLEVGAFGFIALWWIYFRAVRLLAREARRDHSEHGWLLAGLASSIAAFAVGMFTYDAFSFIQVTFLSFILLGMVGVAIRLGREDRLSDRVGAGLSDGRAPAPDAAPVGA
jgi:hypothetical protein